MKFRLLAIICIALSAQLKAQDLVPPKDGAAIRLKDHKIVLVPDQTLTQDIWLVKSKRYAKQEFEQLKAIAPKGMAITIIPNTIQAANDVQYDLFTMKIEAENDLEKGNYTLMIKGEGKYAQKVTSAVLIVTVLEKSVAKQQR